MGSLGEKRLPTKRLVGITLALAWTLLLTLYVLSAGGDPYLVVGVFAVSALVGGALVSAPR